VLEMLGDPDINLWAFPNPDASKDRLYSYEVCDACEADEIGYLIDGVLVSDFLYPAWFESFRRPGSTQFDRQGQITRPFEILPGGYALVYDIRSGTGYHQVTGDDTVFRHSQRPRVGSRRERRMTHRNHWLRSTACGHERWPVKTLTDAMSALVDVANPVPSSIAQLRDLPRPVGLELEETGPRNKRLEPLEVTVFTVTAALVKAKVETTDSDIHLVIADPADASATMIAEFPNPRCINAAVPELRNLMIAARERLLDVADPRLRNLAAGGLDHAEGILARADGDDWVDLNGQAQITGVAFFDHLHHQTGVAPNVIELHPVLSFVPVPNGGQ
jgi:hypothetical protein